MDEARLREKLSSAVHELAGGTGTIQARIADAGYHFCALSLEHDVPEWLREQYSAVDDALTKVHDRDIGSIRATALSLSDEEARALASEMVSMLEEVYRRTGIETGLRQAQRELDEIPEAGGVN